MSVTAGPAEPRARLRVVIAEDTVLLREGLRRVLTDAGLDVAGTAADADQLLKLAWNDPLGVGPERVKFGIMRLRRKLGQDPGPGSAIEAVRGFGYRYVVPQPRSGGN